MLARRRPSRPWAPWRFGRVLLLVALLTSGAAAAWAQVAIPELHQRVTDTTATLSTDQQQMLEARLEALEMRKGSQIAVLIVPTTGSETIEQYGIRVAEAWKLGRKNVDDGAILLVAKKDRKLRIEVGYGLEGAIPDVIAKRIIAEQITPHFRDGDFFAGIDAGTDALVGLVDGEPLPPPAISAHGGSDDSPFSWIAIIVGVILGFIVRLCSNRGAGAATALVVSGLIAILMAGVIAAIVNGIVAFVLVIGGLERGIFSIGGLGGGSSSSSGGFSGGGGGFGGGGASGGW